MYTILWHTSVFAKTCVGITIDKSTPFRSGTNGSAEHAVRRVKKKRFLCSSASVGSFRKVVAVRSDGNASVIGETDKTNCNTESHLVKQDVESHFDGPAIHMGLKILRI